MVLRLDQGAALLVLLGVELGILHHLLDLGVAETARGLDADGLLLAGRLVLGADVDDAVGVDVEGDLDLRHAARRGRNADQVELAEQLVVRRHLSLTLEHRSEERRVGKEVVSTCRSRGAPTYEKKKTARLMPDT